MWFSNGREVAPARRAKRNKSASVIVLESSSEDEDVVTSAQKPARPSDTSFAGVIPRILNQEPIVLRSDSVETQMVGFHLIQDFWHHT